MEYYKSEDLGRFAEVGRFAPDLMQKFFEYYGAVTGQDGALSQREKALIALALVHGVQMQNCLGHKGAL